MPISVWKLFVIITKFFPPFPKITPDTCVFSYSYLKSTGFFKRSNTQIFLVVQWLGGHLPMQGT